MPVEPVLSIIVPVFNEEDTLPLLLGDIQTARQALNLDIETVVVDGGSTDGTAAVCLGAGVRLLSSPRGRGVQMHIGGSSCRGDVLLFLHADTRITPEHALTCLRYLSRPEIVAGGFHLRFDSSHPILRLAQRVNGVRFRLTRVLYGDHGLFIRRSTYVEMGGFARWPLFEDVDLCRRLRRRGRVVMVAPALLTSARRFQDGGVVRTYLRMAGLHFLYRVGVSPWKLARIYGYDLGAGEQTAGHEGRHKLSPNRRPSAKPFAK